MRWECSAEAAPVLVMCERFDLLMLRVSRREPLTAGIGTLAIPWLPVFVLRDPHEKNGENVSGFVSFWHQSRFRIGRQHGKLQGPRYGSMSDQEQAPRSSRFRIRAL